MICPSCNHLKSRVTDSRPLTNGWTQRTRRCLACDTTWQTYEVNADDCEVNPSQLGVPIINRKPRSR